MSDALLRGASGCAAAIASSIGGSGFSQSRSFSPSNVASPFSTSASPAVG